MPPSALLSMLNIEEYFFDSGNCCNFRSYPRLQISRSVPIVNPGEGSTVLSYHSVLLKYYPVIPPASILYQTLRPATKGTYSNSFLKSDTPGDGTCTGAGLAATGKSPTVTLLNQSSLTHPNLKHPKSFVMTLLQLNNKVMRKRKLIHQELIMLKQQQKMW